MAMGLLVDGDSKKGIKIFVKIPGILSKMRAVLLSVQRMVFYKRWFHTRPKTHPHMNSRSACPGRVKKTRVNKSNWKPRPTEMPEWMPC